MEGQLKKISQQIQQEKLVARLEEDKSASRGRVDSLEKRLGEMHASWSELLKEAIGKRETDVSLTGVETRAISEGLNELRQEMARFKEELAGLPAMLPEIKQLREMIPAIASLENTIQGLKAAAKLDAEKFATSEDHFQKLADERDKLIEPLTLEADKVQ